MANRSLEQMILEEQKRVTRGTDTGNSKRPGLLDLALPVKSAPVSAIGTQAKTTTTQAALASPAMTFSKAAQTMAASAINKSYTIPALAPQTSSSAPASGGNMAGEIGKTALKIFSSGLGLMPLISGLAGLFDGGQSAAPAPLVKYAMPRSIQIAAANSKEGGGFRSADYGQDGRARSYNATTDASSPAGGGPVPLWPAVGQSQVSPSASHVVVNVQAMDSRSFMDHSQEIAQAVRDAMLNMHPLNDVVSEL